ncbi:hypothetical protein L0B53_09305 [Vibrio sp. SS-MA-C1-2]|uniref:hypothetical protein n=1 Tax=Vibrio sp. SS-MA-C1-2 TaxID=2908646 RepID=UPI001F3CD71C|nr:hypothetical protein [Vibrio sp. SS-MA-C1-2]UJF19674.1 hypothetical protein L0B53_09305 [Vibrio sp. SS-MA-C1-2]
MKKIKTTLLITLLIILSGCRDSGGFYPDYLPPDPGEAGKAALEGVDSNNNGFRDDIERAAYRLFPDNQDYQKAINLASVIDTRLMLAGEKGDFNEAFQLIEYFFHAKTCVSKTIFNLNIDKKVNDLNFVDILDFIKKENYNTYQRRKALDKFGELMDGQQLGVIVKEDACELIEKSM